MAGLKKWNSAEALFILIVMSLIIQSFTMKQNNVKEKQAAPTFTTTDVNGKPVSLADLRGKKILLTFYRNVGCPICNLRFHEIQEQAAYFKSKDLVVLAVYESSAENMKTYLDGENPYAVLIPNPDQSLYQLYEIERSTGKVFKSLFNGAMRKAKRGKKLFKAKMKQDGHGNTIGGDFLIDEHGMVKTAYYGKFVGDHLPIEKIKDFIN